MHYEVLVDVDLAIAMAFGVVFMMPPLYVALLRHRGIERNGNPAWLLPIPATSLVGRDGIVLRSWVNVDFTHRLDVARAFGVLAGAATCAATFALFLGALQDAAAATALFVFFGASVPCTTASLMGFFAETVLSWRRALPPLMEEA